MKWKKITALALSVCIAAGSVAFSSQAVEAASLSNLQSKQKEIEKALSEINKELSAVKNNIAKEQQYQATLTKQIQLNQEKMDVLDQQMLQLGEDLEENQQQLSEIEGNISAKETEIDDTTDQYKKRMRAMYMAGDTSALQVLFSAGSFGEFLTNIQMMKSISEHDTKLLETMGVQRTELENQKAQAQRVQADIEDQQTQIEAQRAEMEATNKELEAAYQESKSAEHDIALEKQQFEANAAAKKKEAQQIEAEIQAEIKRLQEENERKKQAENGGKPTTFVDGKFIRPTNNGYYISSGYGARWGSTHTGIDITAGGCYGANIYAAASGTVITAGWHWSYGNYVVIDHGGGYSTLYAHCSQLLVSKGQNVGQGDVIAKIGSTGQSTGPHLHFEVRINGKTQNPLNWVSY